MEIVFRINSQVYGGGTSNLRITDIKRAPTIDIYQLSPKVQEQLIDAYDSYLKTGDKKTIDEVVFRILDLTNEEITNLHHLLIDLREMANSAKKEAHPKD